MTLSGLGNLVLAVLYAAFLLLVASAVMGALARVNRSRPHREDCPCVPCREYEAGQHGVCVYVTQTVPGLARDGKLSRREKQAWRGLEAALRGEQAGAGQ